MSGTCAASPNRGWQQENIMRSRSSLIAFAENSSSTTGASIHSLSRNLPSSGANARRALAPHDVQGGVLWRGHQPSRRIVRHAANAPRLHRAAEGVLHHVLCQREVVNAENAASTRRPCVPTRAERDDFAALGELELRRGRYEVARDHFGAALALARNPMERRFLDRRMATCDQTDPQPGYYEQLWDRVLDSSKSHLEAEERRRGIISVCR